ncbi:MAG: Coenzyme F420 hydrogenase/dehydrogenase, beta subunit C-terminal domain [Candidatus Bathyarchaeota archaeon]|nr:Coenzyme F420 hydrogenase/dehydrogenase, beta subunit C-terminal domain [Candidatus Bathyarchaeota archaeon]
MKPAIEEIGKNRCAGCYACQSSCPSHAISTSLNDEGFLLPNIDKNKCTLCGICQHYCPILNLPEENPSVPQVIAASSQNDELRLQSSSGGIFSELARQIIDNNGLVFGAAFDENFNLRHICAETDENLALLRGSKYVQSQIGNAYLDVLNSLKEKRPTLFCGTPCQTAALKNLVEKESTAQGVQKLYLCDVICHGVGSQLVFEEYLSYLSLKKASRLVEYSFRDKRLSWENFGSKARFADDSEYFKLHRRDSFMVGYLRNIYLRESCYNCPFAKVPRISDITLGDFWGAPKNLFDKRGLSVVLINNSKGKDLINTLENVKKHNISLDQVKKENPRVAEQSIYKSPQREDFFKTLKVRGYPDAVEIFLKPHVSFADSFLMVKSGLKKV